MIKFCSLYSGSSGNCIFIGTEKAKILVDAGLSGIKITEALKEIDEEPKELDGILITHEHYDHTKGAGVLSRRFDIPIYANSLTWKELDKSIGHIKDRNRIVVKNEIKKPMQCSLFEILDEEYLDYEKTDLFESFEVGDIGISPFPIPHDSVSPIAYSFSVRNKRISIITDLGYITDTVRDHVLKSDLVMIESNHDLAMLENGRYPRFLKNRILSKQGHLSNDSAASFVIDCIRHGTQNIILGHLSKENNLPKLAYDVSVKRINEIGAKVGKDVTLSVAKRNSRGEVYLW